MKNFYYVVTQHKEDKYYAFTFKHSASYDLYSALLSIPYVYRVNACKSKKEADTLSEIWNKGFKELGNFDYIV